MTSDSVGLAASQRVEVRRPPPERETVGRLVSGVVARLPIHLLMFSSFVVWGGIGGGNAGEIVKLGGLDPKYGIVSIVVGQLLIMAFFCGWLPSSWLFDFESYLLALTICFAICLWGNRVAKKRMRG